MGCARRHSRCGGGQGDNPRLRRLARLNRGGRAGTNRSMLVILDDSGRRVFSDPLAVIRADGAAEVPGALAALEAALVQGRHVAGWLGYELGYALEPRLGGADGPLLRLDRKSVV